MVAFLIVFALLLASLLFIVSTASKEKFTQAEASRCMSFYRRVDAVPDCDLMNMGAVPLEFEL